MQSTSLSYSRRRILLALAALVGGKAGACGEEGIIKLKGKRESHLLYWVAPGFHARAVREGDWKLIVQGKGESKTTELFDLGADPSEVTNLAAKRPDKAAHLQKRLEEVSKADLDSVVKD